MTTQQLGIGEGKPLSEKFALEAIRRYMEANEQIGMYERTKVLAGKIIKDYMADLGLREFHDGEMGLVARLQDRAGPGVFDFGSMTDPDILLLARAGCFSAVSRTALAAIGKANPRAGETAVKYLMPGGVTTALIVTDR